MAVPLCPHRAGWGCFSGTAPGPKVGGPAWYRCTLERGHAGHCRFNVEGQIVELDPMCAAPTLTDGTRARVRERAACETCGAEPGARCVEDGREIAGVHLAREQAYRREHPQGRPKVAETRTVGVKVSLSETEAEALDARRGTEKRGRMLREAARRAGLLGGEQDREGEAQLQVEVAALRAENRALKEALANRHGMGHALIPISPTLADAVQAGLEAAADYVDYRSRDHVESWEIRALDADALAARLRKHRCEGRRRRGDPHRVPRVGQQERHR